MIWLKLSNLAIILVALIPVLPKYGVKGHWKTTAVKVQQIHNWKSLRKVFELIFSSSQCGFQPRKAYALCRRLYAAMSSCDLCMDGWQHRKDSLAPDQAAPVHGVRISKIVIWREEFIVVAFESTLAILPEDDTRDSQRWEAVTGSKTLSRRYSSWNLRRCLLEYEMDFADDYYCTRYCSFRLSRYA